MFGHPSPATLARLADAGVHTLATPRWGSLRIRTDGLDWNILHYSIDESRFWELPSPSPVKPNKLNSGR